ncbi:MAG: hypothetical protein AAF570_22745, partial [Bacteroidota bacterium]
MLTGNTPVTGAGNWALVSGGGNIVAPTSANSAITGLPFGVSEFEWVITSGNCPALRDTVRIQNDPLPTVANAGIDMELCGDSIVNLQGNTPAVGMGTWTVIASSGTVQNPDSAMTVAFGLTTGFNSFEWAIASGVCPVSRDSVEISILANPVVELGQDTTICDSMPLILDAGNTGVNYDWSDGSTSQTLAVSGSGVYAVTVTDANGCSNSDSRSIDFISFQPTFSGLDPEYCTADSAIALTGNPPNGIFSGPGINGNLFEPASAPLDSTLDIVYTYDSSGCVVSVSANTIVYQEIPADAGADQTLYFENSTLLNGNSPTPGTGMWTQIEGSGSIESPFSETTQIQDIAQGTNIFRWTITFGNCVSFDEVQV